MNFNPYVDMSATLQQRWAGQTKQFLSIPMQGIAGTMARQILSELTVDASKYLATAQFCVEVAMCEAMVSLPTPPNSQQGAEAPIAGTTPSAPLLTAETPAVARKRQKKTM